MRCFPLEDGPAQSAAGGGSCTCPDAGTCTHWATAGVLSHGQGTVALHCWWSCYYAASAAPRTVAQLLQRDRVIASALLLRVLTFAHPGFVAQTHAHTPLTAARWLPTCPPPRALVLTILRPDDSPRPFSPCVSCRSWLPPGVLSQPTA